MKRLIMMFATVSMVAVAHAASVQWTCTNVYAGNTTDKNSGIAYLMLASDVADFSALAGNPSGISAALGKAIYNYTPSEAGAYGMTVSNADLGLQDSKDYGKAYLVIFDTATVTATSKFYVTAQKDLGTYEGDNVATVKFASQYAGTSVPGGWSSVATPEPTSGILLLLGMAGLALRRKRA